MKPGTNVENALQFGADIEVRQGQNWIKFKV